ncbi:response regulator transcription factor [Sphingomonas sp. IW22]|uniref:response regulator transcription factor n=1 Tax=Sphingomonas sp. IW22 TaxID=3242489 RepID=UPI003522BDF2
MNVYVVDDDPDLRRTLALLLQRLGHQVQTFAHAAAFMSVARDLTPGCILLDLCMPGMDGLELQSALKDQHSLHQVILLTGFGEIPEAVRAIRAGAVDFLSKPYRRAELSDAIQRAEASLPEALAQHAGAAGGRSAIDSLTPKERDVLHASSGGRSSKQVAHDLSLSVRTVEMHRSSIIRKLGVQNFAGALLIAAREDA